MFRLNLIFDRDLVMWVCIHVGTFTVLELSALESWREMGIFTMKMELIQKNLRIINWYKNWVFPQHFSESHNLCSSQQLLSMKYIFCCYQWWQPTNLNLKCINKMDLNLPMTADKPHCFLRGPLRWLRQQKMYFIVPIDLTQQRVHAEYYMFSIICLSM